MSVYKEGWYGIKTIENNSQRVFNDACDYGAPVYKGGVIWNVIKQLREWYGNSEINPSLRVEKNDIENFFEICLMNEGTGDTSYFKINYTKMDEWKNKPYLTASFKDADGFVSVEPLPQSRVIELDKESDRLDKEQIANEKKHNWLGGDEDFLDMLDKITIIKNL